MHYILICSDNIDLQFTTTVRVIFLKKKTSFLHLCFKSKMLGLRSDRCSNVKTKYRQAMVFLKGKDLMLLQDFHEGQLIVHTHIVPIYSVLNCFWRKKETINNVFNPKDLTFTPFLNILSVI